MELLLKLLTVLGLGLVEIWAAIPAGLALGLPPLVVGVAAAIGGILGTLAVVTLGERVRAWIVRRRGWQEGQGHDGLIRRIWQRYGVIGLGLLAPLLTGAPLGVALGITLGAPARRLLFWASLGIVLWSAALTMAGALGIGWIER